MCFDTIGVMKTLSDKDVEYKREYGKQYYIKKQLEEISAAPRQQVRGNALPYCQYCKSRTEQIFIPAEDGLFRKVCQTCGKGDLYVGSSNPAR
jgi:hypothetical protein